MASAWRNGKSDAPGDGFWWGYADGAPLQRPGRLWMGMGICIGLALGVLVAVFWRPPVVPVGEPTVVFAIHPNRALQPYVRSWIDPEQTSAGQWRVSAMSPKALGVITAPDASTVQVSWHAQPNHPCVETLSPDTEVWRCGRIEQPLRVAAEIPRSLVVLQTQPGMLALDDLATALLDSGSADLVLVTPDLMRYHDVILGDQAQLGTGQQLVVISRQAMEEEALLPAAPGGFVAWIDVADWSWLTHGLQRAPAKQQRLSAVWPLARVLRASGDVQQIQLRGLGEYPNIEFVAIPGGRFTMGSPESDPGRDEEESPQHDVMVSAFWMAKTETTNAEFRVFRPDHTGADDLSAANVTWFEARDFCTRYGYRLPTEAEWEYAARAGTHSRWSFGDNEQELTRYAWYGDNSGIKVHAVGQKDPNPWGLHDMHGNVWEWVQDCYGSYVDAPTDGSAREKGECKIRVLRGGSAWAVARRLRSTVRVWVPPEGRGDTIGFRCVRRPRRQS